MTTHKLVLILLSLVVSGSAKANVVSLYDVTINTSSQATLTGAIYFQFSSGLNSDPATATISSFLIGAPGLLLSNPPLLTDGEVTSTLNALPLVIGNGVLTNSALNDYLHFLTYGDSISFSVSISHPNSLTGDAGSAFLFGLTSDDGFSPILTQDPSGMLGQIAFDQNGKFTVDQLSDSATITSPSAVPEPSTLPLLLAIIGVLALCSIVRRVRSNA
jgi:hypothetical protein